MKKTCVIKPKGGDWQEVPDAIITMAMCDLSVNATHEEFADFAARLMEVTGSYDVEFRKTDDAGVVTVTKAFSGTVPPRQPGDPIVEMPGGLAMVAVYINPDAKQHRQEGGS